jgi:hypothetical protein
LASVIVDWTHTACGSGMQAASATISSLGFELDLMWHRDLTRMRRRNTARSGSASVSSAAGGSWASGHRSTAVARFTAARERERESDRSDSDRDGRKTKGMGSTPPRVTLFIGGPPNLSVAVPSTVQSASMALSREVCEKIKADFSLIDQVLRPKSEFRSSAKQEDNIMSS